MNQMIKNICYSVVLCFFFLISIPFVHANSIQDIDMDIYIDSFGNASVKEIWTTNLTSGTEGFKSYTDLGNMSITNFKVSDDSGTVYESLPSWNTSASFQNKAYKNGIHKISGGVELCWGISQYGKRTYTLNYEIQNLVTEYTDTQGIYFNFLNLDQPVGNAKITIHSDIDFSLDNAKIWAFGYDGTDIFENGSIVLNSNGNLSSSDYMVGLIRFESPLFATNNHSTKSFDDIYDSAFSDVSNDDGNYSENPVNTHTTSFKNILPMILMIPFYGVLILLNPFILFFVLYAVKGRTWVGGSGKRSGELNFGTAGKTLPREDEIPYWREIPCEKDLERAYWVSTNYHVVPEKTLREGIIGAILLKWIRDGKIFVSKTKKGLFNLKDNDYAIDFSKMTQADNEVEDALFRMLVKASGSNKILEAKEFYKWSRKNYYKVESWFSSILSKEQNKLEEQGLITNSTEEVAGMFGTKRTIVIKNVDPSLKEEAIHLRGLRKFLLDFSMMPEREYFEVHIWEEYLIFAQLLGIADKVEEQFSKLYPKFNEVTSLNMDVTTVVVRSMAINCYKGFYEGVKRAEARAASHDYSGSSSSSGGGGSSFSSGGSSSGGSSGGGFR